MPVRHLLSAPFARAPARRSAAPGRAFFDAVRLLTFAAAIRPFFGLWMGAQVRGLDHLPRSGPLLMVANHESHLDTLFLLGLLPLPQLRRAKAAGALDSFFRPTLLGWLARFFVRVIPVDRAGPGTPREKLAKCREVLAQGGVVVLFPEGTRAPPEHPGPCKRGWVTLVEDLPSVPVVPVGLAGLGRSLPKGALFPLPLLAGGAIGAPLHFHADKETFVVELEAKLRELRRSLGPAPVGAC